MRKFLPLSILALLAALAFPQQSFAACAGTITVLDGTGASKTMCDTTDGGTGLVPSHGILGGTNNANKLSITSNSAALVEGVGTAGSAAGGVATVQGVASMTPILTNPGTAANIGVGATASAVPANAAYVGASASGNLTGVVGCDAHKFVHVTSATDTLLVQGVTAKTIKICGVLVWFAGTNTVFLENTASTNANCSSANTQIAGAWSGVAQSIGGFNSSFWNGLANTSANGLCLNSTGTGAVDVDLFYTQGS